MGFLFEAFTQAQDRIEAAVVALSFLSVHADKNSNGLDPCCKAMYDAGKITEKI